jgi:hypothetical protein
VSSAAEPYAHFVLSRPGRIEPDASRIDRPLVRITRRERLGRAPFSASALETSRIANLSYIAITVDPTFRAFAAARKTQARGALGVRQTLDAQTERRIAERPVRAVTIRGRHALYASSRRHVAVSVAAIGATRAGLDAAVAGEITRSGKAVRIAQALDTYSRRGIAIGERSAAFGVCRALLGDGIPWLNAGGVGGLRVGSTVVYRHRTARRGTGIALVAEIRQERQMVRLGRASKSPQCEHQGPTIGSPGHVPM